MGLAHIDMIRICYIVYFLSQMKTVKFSSKGNKMLTCARPVTVSYIDFIAKREDTVQYCTVRYSVVVNCVVFLSSHGYLHFSYFI